MLKTLEDNKELLQFNAEGVDPGEIWTEACVACKVAVETSLSLESAMCLARLLPVT